jgi:hypothetical protein
MAGGAPLVRGTPRFIVRLRPARRHQPVHLGFGDLRHGSLINNSLIRKDSETAQETFWQA